MRQARRQNEPRLDPPWTVAADYKYEEPTSLAYRHPDYKAKEGGVTSGVSAHRADLHGEVYGMFAEIRRTVDYSWHSNYTRQRQAWQDELVVGVLGQATPELEPWVVFTCGAMGAGKGHVMNWLAQHSDFPLHNMVCIDPDKFKTALPEWSGYLENNLENAGTMCHKESGFLQEVAQEVALRSSCNIWVDGSLGDHAWYSSVFEDLRARFPHYRIAILHVQCKPETVFARAERRGRQTGRFVPEAVLKASIDATCEAIRVLGPLADFVAEVDNESDPPWLQVREELPLPHDSAAEIVTIGTLGGECGVAMLHSEDLLHAHLPAQWPSWLPSKACGTCVAAHSPLMDFVTKVNRQLDTRWIKVRCCSLAATRAG